MSVDRLGVFHHMVSSTIASITSTLLTHPMDLVRTRLQSSRKSITGSTPLGRLSLIMRPLNCARYIIERDGVVGLSRGLLPAMVGTVPSRVIFFCVYERMKLLLGGHGPVTHFGSTAAAILINSIIMNPMFIMKTRMMLQESKRVQYRIHYTSYWDCAKGIYRVDGLSGFWKGITATWLGLAEIGTYFMLYEYVKEHTSLGRRLQHNGDSFPVHLIAMTVFGIKMCSGAIGYPHRVLRTRLREVRWDGRSKYDRGLWGTAREIVASEGMVGLYSGYGTHMLRSIPSAIITFMMYEYVKHRVFKNIHDL